MDDPTRRCENDTGICDAPSGASGPKRGPHFFDPLIFPVSSPVAKNRCEIQNQNHCKLLFSRMCAFAPEGSAFSSMTHWELSPTGSNPNRPRMKFAIACWAGFRSGSEDFQSKQD
jgi:hypothetical protein